MSTTVLFHRTQRNSAARILRGGFRDGTGSYMTDRDWTGVWVSDRPLDADEGAIGDAVLRIELERSQEEIGQYEWIEDGKPYREWLVPAELLNALGTVSLVPDSDVQMLD